MPVYVSGIDQTNVAIGTSFGVGCENVIIGSGAASGTPIAGTECVAIGALAAEKTTSGNRNVAVGARAARAVTTGSHNVSVGSDAMGLNEDGDRNVAVGDASLKALRDGSSNVALGVNAAAFLAEGSHNVFLGSDAGSSLVEGSGNVMIGRATGNHAMNESIVLSTGGTGAVRMRFTEWGDCQIATGGGGGTADPPPPGFISLGVDSESGSLLVRSNRDGSVRISSTVPTEKLSELVSARDFGATGDGVTDDTPAIRCAAAAANAAGVPLRIGRGVYYIDSPANIELRVSLDASGAVFKLGPGMTWTTLFLVVGNPLEDITANIERSEISKDRSTIASLAAYRNGFLRIRSDVPHLKRRSDTPTLLKEECGYVTKGGVLVTPVLHSYAGEGGVTRIEYRRDESDQLVVSGGAVDVNNKSGARFLMVQRNDVKVRNWTVMDSSESSKIDTALLFRVFDCANFVMEDISGDSMNQAVSASHSYLVEISYGFNCRFARCFVHGGWGAFAANGVNGYHIRDSNFDRFDIHYDGYDMTVDNCVFYLSVQYGSGGGSLRVTNSTKIAKDVRPFLSTTSQSCVVVRTRGDYGGTWDGDVLISGVKVKVSADFVVSTLNHIQFFRAEATGDFGAERALVDPHTIVLRDCLVEAPQTTLAIPSFGVCGVWLQGSRATAGSPGTVPPRRIVVDNLSVNDRTVRGVGVTDLFVHEGYRASIVAGNNVPRIVRSFGTVDAVRGDGAVDLQSNVVDATRVASGDRSVVSGGQSNAADGARSWVPGGSQATTRGRNGSWAWGSNPDNQPGRYQASGMMLQARTVDTTPTRMVSDAPGSNPGVSNQFSLPRNSACMFQAMVVARGTTLGSTGGSTVKAWKVEGVTRNSGGSFWLIAPTSVTVVAEMSDASSWTLAVTTDNILDCPAFTVTGGAATPIDWAARIEAVEWA